MAAGGGVSTDALDLIQGALGPQVLADAAERLGEQPAALGRFVGAGVPAVLQRLIERGTAPGGAEALLGAMRRTGAARALADPLARLEPGAQPDSELVGDDLPGRLAAYAGVGGEAAAALTAMLTPLALGAVARIAPTPLTPDTLARTLREQEAAVARALPPGFDQAAAAPAASAPPHATAPSAEMVSPVVVPTPLLEPVADTAPPQPVPIAQPPAAVPDAGTGAPAGGGVSRWLLIAVALLMVLALLWVLMGNLGAGDTGRSPAEPAAPASEAAPASP
jgi:hypothetical protein